jgi:hypothetical protein
MANKLSDEIKTLYQRTGTNAGQLRTEAERAAFASNVKADVANIIYQYNVVVKPLLAALSSEQGLNALDFGLSGNVLYTHIAATEADAVAYYDEGLGRARTVKETIDVLLSELARLENLIDNIEDIAVYDDTALRTLIGTDELNLDQLVLDTMGDGYTLGGDGAADLNYSLSQAIDALGSFFTGFPGTGNTYSTSYPSITFSVLLSQVVLDTTIPISTITNLTNYLSYIRTFIGMDTVGPETPTYTAHGVVKYVSNGDSLEKSIRVLDAAIAGGTLQASYDKGAGGTAGKITLANARGKIIIKDDPAVPINSMQEWQDTAGVSVAEMTPSGLALKSANATLQIDQRGADPAAVAGKGALSTRPSGGDAELFYRGSNAAVGNAQITRKGIVKELEVGCDWIRPGAMVQTAGVTRNVIALGAAPNTDIIYEALQMPDGNPVNSYILLSPPRCEDGTYPTRASIEVWSSPTTNPGAGPFQYDLALFTNDTNNAVAPNSELLVAPANFLTPAQWQFQGDFISPAFNLPADLDRIYLGSWSITVAAAAPGTGLMVLKLQRNTFHASDNYTGDVSLLGARVTWWR